MLSTYVRVLSRSALFLLLYACRTVDCSMINCEDMPPDVQDPSGGLTIAVVEKVVELPARVEVLFKVDSNDGDPVARLSPANFELADDEKVNSPSESINIFENTGVPYSNSVLLLLDLSGSVTSGQNLDNLKNAALTFVAEMASLDQATIGIWWFDGGPDIRQLSPFTTNADSLNLAIASLTDSLPGDKSTNLNGAIVAGLDFLEKRMKKGGAGHANRVGTLVVFTDGTDQAARLSQDDALGAIDDAGDNIFSYSIGVKGEVDEAFLEKIGSDGSAIAPDIHRLVPSFRVISDRIRAEAASYYLLQYCSPRRSPEWHQLDITAHTSNDSLRGSVTTWYSSEGFEGGCELDSLTF